MRTLVTSGLVLWIAGQAAGQATLILEADPAGGQVAPGQVIAWRLFVDVDPDGSRGLAGMAADLVTDLTNLAPGFEFERAVNTSNFPDSNRQIDLGPHFVNQVNLGTRILKEGLATLQTIGGTQDTVDNIASTLDVGGQTVDLLSGVVIEGVGQSGRVLAAHGSFTIPADAAAGEFQLWTGGVPGNPGQTKVNLLTEIAEVTRGGTDARWRVISLSPVDQQGVFDFTIVANDSPPAGGGGGAPAGGGGGDDTVPPPDDPDDILPAGDDTTPPDDGGTTDPGTDDTTPDPDDTTSPTPDTTEPVTALPMPAPICGLGIGMSLALSLFGLSLIRFAGRRRE